MQHFNEVRNIFCNALSINDRKDSLTENSVLFGNIPELDSMTLVNVITALEENFDIIINDDEISAEIFETLASLTCFVDDKLAE